MAQVIRAQVHDVVARHAPAGAHIPIRRVGEASKRGITVLEQVVWPLSYGPGADAVIIFAVEIPGDPGCAIGE